MIHCVKSFSGSYFPAYLFFPYSVRMSENKDQKNSEYGHLRAAVSELTELLKISLDFEAK